MRNFLLLSVIVLLMAFSFFSGQIFYFNKDLNNVYELVLRSEVFSEKIKTYVNEMINENNSVDHKMIKDAFEKGDSLLSEDLSTANIYYSKALFEARWSMDYVNRYVEKMSEYCNSLVLNGSPENAPDLICPTLFSEIDAFLRSQAVQMSITDIDKLQDVLKRVNDQNSQISIRFAENQRNIRMEEISSIRDKAVKLIDEGTFDDYQEMLLLSQSLSQLDGDIEISDGFGMGQVRENLNQKISAVLYDQELKKIEKNADTLIHAYRDNPGNQTLKSHYSGLASILLNNYLELLLTSGRPLEQIDEVEEKLHQPIKEMENSLVDSRIKEFKKQIEEIGTLRSDKKLEEALELESKIRQVVIILEDEELKNEKNDLRTSLGDLRNKISNYNNEKISSYNKWAMVRISGLFTEASDAKSTLWIDDKEKLISVIESYLGNIDTNYLNLNTTNAYNEVYSYSSSSLNAKQKVDIIDKLINSRKRPLNDF